jgi:uncharacterized membrane protein YkoI
MEEKAVVKIDAEGGVTSCPKGEVADCGFTGGKVCGKCGAMAVQLKAKDEDAEETLMDEVDEKGAVTVSAIPGKDEMPVEDPISAKPSPGARGKGNLADAEDPAAAIEGDESDPSETVDEDMKRRKAARARRLAMIGGLKSAEVDDEAFLCGLEKKVLAGNCGPCAGCVGGCKAEGDLPTLVEIEGLALMDHDGIKVLDSGYSDTADMFLVDVQQKDGNVVEVIYEGDTGECISWKRLPQDLIGQKSAEVEPIVLIGFDAAADIAVKSIGGFVTEITPGALGEDEVYVVEVKSDEGDMSTVIVALDGEILESSVEAKGEAEAEVEVKADETEEASDEPEVIEIKAADDPEFLASLMDFELIEVEVETTTIES